MSNKMTTIITDLVELVVILQGKTTIVVKYAGVAKLVYAWDLKSQGRNLVRVQIPLPAPISIISPD